jgi:hypothetical protein
MYCTCSSCFTFLSITLDASISCCRSGHITATAAVAATSATAAAAAPQTLSIISMLQFSCC